MYFTTIKTSLPRITLSTLRGNVNVQSLLLSAKAGCDQAIVEICYGRLNNAGHDYTASQKTVQNCFCQNFDKFPPILIIFDRKMAKRLKLCEMHSFSTSSNSRHHTTVLNADVRNCYITLKVVICSKLSNDLNSTNKVKCGLFSRIISSYNSSV